MNAYLKWKPEKNQLGKGIQILPYAATIIGFVTFIFREITWQKTVKFISDDIDNASQTDQFPSNLFEN